MLLMRNSSFYTKTIENVYDLYRAHIGCSYEDILKRPCLVLSNSLPSIEVINALEASFAYVGYVGNACIPLSLSPINESYGSYCLDSTSLNILIEGLDPHFLIALDQEAFISLNKVYRNNLVINEAVTILGRHVVSFENFSNSLNTQKGKQRVWTILKAIFT